MKKILLILILIISASFGAKSYSLDLFAKVDEKKVLLKWLPKSYSEKSSYKLFRNDTLIAEITPTPYDALKQAGKSEDYLYIVHPFRKAKTIDDQIMIFKAEKKAAAFRVLRFMKDNTFAKDLGQFYIDEPNASDFPITYKLQMFRSNQLKAEESISIKNEQMQKPAPVFSLNAKSSSKGVQLIWSSDNTYAFYNVYRKNAEDASFMKLTPMPIYVSPTVDNSRSYYFQDTTLKAGEEAEYYVKKLDIFAQEGEPSLIVKAKKLINDKPEMVKNIFVKPRDNKIILRWQKVKDSLGYNIYRSINYQGGYKKINQEPLKKEAYFDDTIIANRNYYYYVTSINMHGESYPSTKMLGSIRDVVPPSLPQNLRADVTPGNVELVWDGVKDKDLLGYRVYMSMEQNATQWSLINKSPVSKNSYTHNRSESLSRHHYYYYIAAVDKNFNESARSNIVKIKLPDITPPKQPVIKKFDVNDKYIRLEWNAIEVYDISHYNVYRNGKEKLNDTPVRDIFFIDEKPLSGSNKYIVTAVDTSNNESNKTQSVSIISTDTVAAKIENMEVVQKASEVLIRFENYDEDYNGFQVFRSNGSNTNFYPVSDFIQDKKEYRDNSFFKGRKNYYKIQVFDKSGNISESKVFEVSM